MISRFRRAFVGRLNSRVMPTTLAHQLADYACALHLKICHRRLVHEVTRVLDCVGLCVGRVERAAVRKCQKKSLRDFSARQGSTIIARATKRRRIGRHSRTAVRFAILITNDTYLSEGAGASRATIFPPHCDRGKSVGASGAELITAIALASGGRVDFCDRVMSAARGGTAASRATLPFVASAIAVINSGPLAPTLSRSPMRRKYWSLGCAGSLRQYVSL